MLERDLQDYLFDNPDVLFPNQTVTQKRREVYIEGKRIDLLFDVEGIQYIIEIKRGTIKREDIGQVFEYYGLMRLAMRTMNFRMMLVAPSIPEFRRIPLEEMGIRCVEVKRLPESIQERTELQETSVKQQKRERADSTSTIAELYLDQLQFQDFTPPVTPRSMQISHKVLRDALPAVQKTYSAYEIRPIKMVKPNQPDVLCIPIDKTESQYQLLGAGAWWAYSFGHSDQMPKNDLPNISVNALPWGLDFAINAELQTSQKVMRDKITADTDRFDHLVSTHGNLQLQAWLKFEFQPRLYYWVLLPAFLPKTWSGKSLLNVYNDSINHFNAIRQNWVTWIKLNNSNLTTAQFHHLERTNKNLNLAMRLVNTFEKENEVWTLPYAKQIQRFESEYIALKPLIDFFQ